MRLAVRIFLIFAILTTFTQGIDGYETETNDTPEDADSVISGDPITGVTTHINDDDWYVFDASAPGLLSVNLGSVVSDAYDYFNVIAYDADHTILSSRRGGGNSYYEDPLSFTVAAPTSGLYYIVVESSTAHTTDPYDLTVNFTEGSLTSFAEDYETESNNIAPKDNKISGINITKDESCRSFIFNFLLLKLP